MTRGLTLYHLVAARDKCVNISKRQMCHYNHETNVPQKARDKCATITKRQMCHYNQETNVPLKAGLQRVTSLCSLGGQMLPLAGAHSHDCRHNTGEKKVTQKKIFKD